MWARTKDLKPESMRAALWEHRTLIKTWAMRGTLHMLPSSELPIWYAVLRTSQRFLRPSAWRKYFGISMEQLDGITEAIGSALDGRLLTRDELGREVGKLIGSASLGAKLAESSWGTMLRPAAFAGRLCFAPSVGQRVRFTRPDSWLGNASSDCAKIDAHDATASVTRRYLAAFGPATEHDLARWWNGGGVSTARKWIAALGDEVVPVDLAGCRAWMLAKHVRELRDLPPVRSVRLLPGFDQYVVASSCHVNHLMPGDLRSRVFRPQGWISPVLLVNGMIQGTWRHATKGSRVEVTIEPFVKLPAWVRRGAEEEAERLAEFLGGELKLEFIGQK